MHMCRMLLLTLSLTAVCTVQADPAKLSKVLAAQPGEVKARYEHRHPYETLEFFGIEPGMTVVEALPGEGWYTKILLPYLGTEGSLIGVDYAQSMWPLFGFFPPEMIEAKKTWVQTWPAEANGWGVESGAPVTAFVFGSLPDSMKGTADAVLMIRALHNLKRFESQGGYFTGALKDSFDVLKPGGILGVEQHWAPDGSSDAFADGSHGYLKKDALIKSIEAAGFQFVAESDINTNPKDQPGEDDIVWRLPPTLATSKDNPELAAKMTAIGESNRMTLKFKKP